MSVQCRVRACTSFPRLPRARARAHVSEREDLSLSLSRRLASPVCIHLSLSLSLPLSLYPYLLSISLTCMYICVYPLLRGSFSRRINLYVYKQSSAFRARVRNALLPPTCVVTFGRAFSSLSSRPPLRAYTYRELEEETGRLSIGPCPWSSLTPCSCREKPFLSSDFSSSDYANFE